jgi:CubicO group peptidase (beta-lactamase class C family)
MADRALEAAIERKDIPGVVAMAVNRQGVIYQGAFGTADVTGRALAVDAIFNIASMTKPITTIALLQLVEGGRISLDDRAAKYLPELGHPVKFESFDPVTKSYQLQPVVTPITIRHLVTHTAGFGYTIWSATLRDFKPRAGEHYETPPLLFEPGTQWAYSTGIDYVGRIVESLSARNIEE